MSEIDKILLDLKVHDMNMYIFGIETKSEKVLFFL